MTQRGPVPQIIKTTRISDKAKEPWLRIYVDGKFEHGYRGEGSILKTIEEIIYWASDDTTIEFFIDKVKYELPPLKRYYYWGQTEGTEKLEGCIEDWVDFHKAFYYFEEKEEYIPAQILFRR
jgi:hypothetical protein